MKTKKLLIILLILVILITNITTSYSKVLTENERVNLVKDHTCVSLLKVKGKDSMKTVVYVCYLADGKRYPAFCVQPDKDGVGMGAGDSYDVTVNQIQDNVLWRMLYKGYMGSSYQSWGLECDDDLYYATKTAVHCMAEGIAPTDKYEVATRVGWYDNISLEEVKRRSAKVLDVAQAIYNFGYSGTENYMKPQITITKNGDIQEKTIGGIKYAVQNYKVTANKALSTYKVSIANFPSGTKILNSSNAEAQTMSDSSFNIAIPITNITGNITGNINITEAKVKTYPIFYADSKNENTQNYVTYADPTEDGSARSTLSINGNKSTLQIKKTDAETGVAISGAVFNVKYNDGTNIGNYTTNSQGIITVSNLKQDIVKVKEISVPDKYILDTTEKSVKLEYNSTSTLNITNSIKKGYIEVTKKDAKTGKIVKKANTEFEILKNSNIVATIKTNAEGIAKSGLLEYGTYTVREKTNPHNYTITTSTKTVNVTENNKTYKIDINNQAVTGQIILKKTDKETGTTIPQGDATLKGATYILKANENILDPSDGSVIFAKDTVISSKAVSSGTWGDTGTKVIDNNYQIIWSNLPMGSYRIEESIASNGYLLDNAHIVTLDSTSSSKAVEVKNVESKEQVKKGYIEVTKKDAKTGKIVKKAGTEFEILYNNKVVCTIKTNEQGIAKTDLLPYARYTVREKNAPNEYVITTETKTVDVYENNKVYKVDIKNQAVVGQVSMKKIDTVTGKVAQGEATLKGAVYGIYARTPILDPADGSVIYDTNAKVGELITDENASATMGNLYLGQYYLLEEKPSTGYTLDTTKYDFELTYENQNVSLVSSSVTVKERVISQAFEMIKISCENNGEAELLAGVEFTIKSQKDIEKYGSWELAPIAKNAEGKEAAKLITDSKGYAVSEKLPYGSYVVRETKVPNDKYKVPDFIVEITKDSDTPQTWRVFNDTSFKAVLAIIKQDAETQKIVKISGAKFKIKNIETGKYFGYWDWNPLPHYVDEWETNETGCVMTGVQLLAGKYQLEEQKSPNGYLISNTPIEFEITSKVAYQTLPDGSTPVISVKQEDTAVKGKINIEKRGEVLIGFSDGKFIYKKQGLANAKYEVFAREDIYDPSNDGTILYKKDSVVDTIITDSTGRATSKAIPLGEYSIREKQAPEEFVLNNEVKNISLKYKDQNTAVIFDNTSFTNERQKISIDVFKKDKENNIGLLGAEFGLYAKEDIVNNNGETIVKAGQLIETAVSDANGKVHFISDLPLTYFQIKELKAPIGYASSNEVIEVDATYRGQDTNTINLEYEFKNEITKVEISKQDITNSQEIEGAQLAIFEKDNIAAIFDTWISGQDGRNEDGTIKTHLIKGLEVGKTYVLRETSSPYGFAIAEDIEFTVQDTGEIQTVTMKDELVFGKLQFNKVGEIFNQTILGQTEFGKTESPVWNKSNLLGAEITIYANEDITIGNTIFYKKDEKIQTLESDWESVLSKELPVGEYYYLETLVPFDYIGNTNKHYFTVQNTQLNQLQIIESSLINDRVKYNINMKKVLEEQKIFVNDKAYKDIVFGIFAREDIYDYMGNVAIKNGTMISTTGIKDDGTLENIPYLPNGVFFIKELSTNSQYVLNDKEYDFEIAYQGKDIAEYTIQIGENGIIDNKLARGTIKIKKIDTLDENKKIENIAFNLSTKKDMSNIIATVKTNEFGIAIFDNVELGTFYIQEEKQVEGYTLNDTIYEVKIKQDGDLVQINCENKPTQMNFSKVDETGVKEIPGATIQIIDKETNEIVEEWVSTEKQHIVNYLIENKEYIMREINAPYGYEIAEEIIFIAGDGKIVTMKDMPILKNIKLVKIDKETNEIIKSNFVFGIYEDKECTKLIKEVKSNVIEGTVLFENLRYSTLFLKELESPQGYELSDKVVKIEINDKGVFADKIKLEENNEVYILEYANKKIEVPKTGDERNTILWSSLLGISTIILIILVIYKIIKKRKNK